MNINLFNNLSSSFLALAENEVTTLSKLAPSELISMMVGFIFILAGCFLKE